MPPMLRQEEQYPWRIAGVKQAGPIPESDHWGRTLQRRPSPHGEVQICH